MYYNKCTGNWYNFHIFYLTHENVTSTKGLTKFIICCNIIKEFLSLRLGLSPNYARVVQLGRILVFQTKDIGSTPIH